MKPNKPTKEYLKQLEQLRLSDAARARMAKELGEYADYHAVPENVRVASESRSMKQVSQSTLWYTALFTKRTTMPFIAIAAAVLIGGGTSFAAQGSLPGDMLYPVKVHVIENVRSTLALGADAEARLQADLLEERVEEAMELKTQGRLEGELETKVNARVAAQTEAAERANDDSDAEVETDTNTRIRLAIAAFDSLRGGDGALAINTDTRAEARLMAKEESGESAAAANADAYSTSMLAVEPVEVGELQRMTTARMESLRSVLERHEDEIRADVHAEMTATLDEADELMIQVMIQSSTDVARRILLQISDLVGKVEATLSTMGTVKIDTNTGAIVDIDLSTPPPAEPDRGDGNDPVEIDPLPLPMPPEVLETSGSIQGEVEATTGLSL